MTELYQFAIPENCVIPEHAIGVWQIPEIDISVPVFARGKKTEQQIIDEENSAAYVRWVTAYQIADHYKSQTGRGKWRIDKIHPLTLAYFVKHDGIHKYECYRTCVADVRAYGWYTINGVAVVPYSSRDIMCNCCVGSDSRRNFIAVFRYIGKMP